MKVATAAGGQHYYLLAAGSVNPNIGPIPMAVAWAVRCIPGLTTSGETLERLAQ